MRNMTRVFAGRTCPRYISHVLTMCKDKLKRILEYMVNTHMLIHVRKTHNQIYAKYMVSHIAFVLSFFVSHPVFGASGWLCFVIVAFPGYLPLYF